MITFDFSNVLNFFGRGRRTRKLPLATGTLGVLYVDRKHLMMYRCGGKNDIHDRKWTFPGGRFKLVDDEGVLRREIGTECVEREFQEETGLNLTRPRLSAVIYFDNRYRTFNGERARFDFLAQYYFSDEYSGQLNQIGPEGHPLRWFRYSETQNVQVPMHEGDREITKRLSYIGKFGLLEGVVVHRGEKLERAIFKEF